MSVSLKPLTVEEFLVWERQQELRYEFDGIQPIGMAGGNSTHSRIQTRLITVLVNRVGPPCEVHGSELKVVTRTRVRYPDAAVLCGANADDGDVIQPTAVFEVLSPSTAMTDRRVKPFDYASVPSIMVYVILDAELAEATVMRRSRGWEEENSAGLQAIVPLPEIGIELPLAAIYQR